MIIQGLKRLSTQLPKSNHCIKRKESTYFVIIFCLTGGNFVVFCEGTVAVRITLKNEKLGMLYGNHIRRLIRKQIVVSVSRRGAYVLNKKGCYADSRALVGSYLETIYT